MTFLELKEALSNNFDILVGKYAVAYQTDADKDKLWETYLESFPTEFNGIYRKRRRFDCSNCRHFIKDIGGIVFIDSDLNLHSIWECEVSDTRYQKVLDALHSYVSNCHVVNQFITKEKVVGTSYSHEYDLITKEVTTWDHFSLMIPNAWRYDGRDTIDTERAKYQGDFEVFKRSLDTITLDSIDTVLELINSNTLYRGAEWKTALEDFKRRKFTYEAIPEKHKYLYVWRTVPSVGQSISRIRNHSIGVLLMDISSGMELNEAVRRYEKIVAPANYKRPKAIYTAKMLEEAKNKITELGYLNALRRRYANLDDITVNNILFSNKDAAKRIKSTDIFDDMLSDAKTSSKKFDRVEEIPIEKFISDVLPNAKRIEAYVENRHAANMMSLITAVDPTAKSMFKWGNPFSWSYAGNIADSDIRENVKNAGGNINGVLRFSIQWNDTGEWSRNDLDAHCVEPNRNMIYFGDRVSRTGGSLDVDIINPKPDVPAVENIVYTSKRSMIPGTYRFYVNQYTNRGGRDGFRAEIEMDGQVFRYNYSKELRQGESIDVAYVKLGVDGSFTIHHCLDSQSISSDLWGVKTMNFVPVSVIMYSPNYWDEKSGFGNKHYFFMLSGCINPEKPNGFFNEYLKPELVEHKRVFEALGSKMAVEDSPDQLSGLGFSSTQRNELIVKVTGNTERVMKIKF